MDALRECTGFEWDEHNAGKNWEQHRVAPHECEQAFLNLPLVVMDDAGHSRSERRYYALGQTDVGRRLFMAFTIRGKLVRVICARDMSRKERKAYEEQEDENPEVQG